MELKRERRKDEMEGKENLINLYKIWKNPGEEELDVGERAAWISFKEMGTKSRGVRGEESRKRDE